jgi:hypothetical protein
MKSEKKIYERQDFGLFHVMAHDLEFLFLLPVHYENQAFHLSVKYSALIFGVVNLQTSKTFCYRYETCRIVSKTT